MPSHGVPQIVSSELRKSYVYLALVYKEVVCLVSDTWPADNLWDVVGQDLERFVHTYAISYTFVWTSE